MLKRYNHAEDKVMAKRYISKRIYRKKRHSSILKSSLLLVLLAVLPVIFWLNKTNATSPQTQAVLGATLPQTTPTSTPTATPSALPSATIQATTPAKPKVAIPTNSGRSVRVPILTYHYIGNNPNPGKDRLRDDLSVTPDKFDAQLGYLASSGFTPITFDTLFSALKGQASLPPKPVILTFDDGYIDFYINAFPILQKYNFHATSFIPTGLIGKSYYLHWEQIKKLQGSGLISFEPHTVDHVNLPNQSDGGLHYQVVESKKALEAQIGKGVNFFAYPYGTSNEKVWRAVKEAGYKGAVGTWFGDVESEGNILDMPRIKIAGGLTLEQFKQKIH